LVIAVLLAPLNSSIDQALMLGNIIGVTSVLLLCPDAIRNIVMFFAKRLEVHLGFFILDQHTGVIKLVGHSILLTLALFVLIAQVFVLVYLAPHSV
jgi:hypothetical protein